MRAVRARHGGAALRKRAPGLRLLDEAPLGGVQRELRRHLGRQVERVHHHVGRRVDREVERGAPVEGADLDHVAP